MDYDTESAYGATTDDSSVNTKSCKSRRNRKGRKAKDTDKSDAKEKKKKKNNCPHCKKFNRRRPHPNVPKEKCFWNKKYKGWRPSTVCNELEIDFKPQRKFTAKLEGGIRWRTANDGVGLKENTDGWKVVTGKNATVIN